jgi:cyclic pyranopterin phosphate synthase
MTVDRLGRPLRTLRISVTDRCNLRCQYCMPEQHYTWLARPDLLSFDEIIQLVDVFTSLGVDKVRLTGGEPLLRPGLADLVRELATMPAVRDLSMTTNGVLLTNHIDALVDAGLHRLTVSLDTLRPDRFRGLSQRDAHGQVLAGITAAVDRLGTVKLDTVVLRDFNDDELIDLIEFAGQLSAEVRFIEYMDVGGATNWSPTRVFSRADILTTISKHYGTITELPKTDTAPADRFALPDGRTFGIISSTTQPFCASCDRSRLTADGIWLRCLYALQGTDLRTPLRNGTSPSHLEALIRDTWRIRTDRGAVDRLAAEAQRRPLVSPDALRRNPHLEMHTRGG